MRLTPDEKILIYTVNDNLYITKTDDLATVKHYKLSFHPYNYYFTKEGGDWVINIQGLNEFKFPLTKKYSLGKLSKLDIKKSNESKGSFTNTEVNGNTQIPTSTNSNFSLADEIKKLKELFDMGAITQDEYNAAKAKLLNIPKEPAKATEKKPNSNSTPNSKNTEADYSDWLFIKSDKALQVRYKLVKQEGEIGQYSVQFRINFEDEIFCKSETCKGYLLTFGYPDLNGIKNIYSHYKFYNTFKGIYTYPKLIPIKTSFNDGSKRFLTKQGFSFTTKNSTEERAANLFDNCVDIITTREPISKCNCVAWKKMFVEAEAETLE